MTRRRKVTLAVAALVLAGVAAAVTYALWDRGDSEPGGQVLSGDLKLTLVGGETWQETSPDVPGTPRTIDPTTFRATPGDALGVTHDFTTTLEGDNIAGVVTVRWASGAPANLPTGVTATYTLLDQDGAVVPGTAGTALGSPVSVSGLPVGARAWTLTVDLQLASQQLGYVDPTQPVPAAPTVADLGDIVVDLDQVRQGAGFSP